MTENKVGGSPKQARSSDQPKRSAGTITLVLTADNHLGYTAFGQHPRKREEQQQRLRRAFQQATDFAVGQGVDFFMQAGDLFDSASPDERDRSFVSARLAQLRQAGVRVFALGGVHDTPPETHSLLGEAAQAPQASYAHLGVLHYFPPNPAELEPEIVKIRDLQVGICGLGVLAGQEGNPLTRVKEHGQIERAAISLLLLHAPIEGLTVGTSLLDSRAQVSRSSIENQSVFRYILAGYHHSYQHLRIGRSQVIVAGATQRIDFSTPEQEPGFVFLGLAADGIRWCKHIAVDSLKLQRLLIQTGELWTDDSNTTDTTPTDTIIERLQPLCSEETMVQLRLAGTLTRGQYHQLDLIQIRRYGEEHCFALAIDDSGLEILPELEAISAETGERFSPREELIALADEWIAAAQDEQEKKTLGATKEDLLAAMDEVKRR
jgi:DNA repair exonuclease SbcCD nuclease subunit